MTSARATGQYLGGLAHDHLAVDERGAAVYLAAGNASWASLRRVVEEVCGER